MSINYATGEVTGSLTAMERSALTHAEAKIQRGLATFLEVGEALAEVREGRLYREVFGTFEAYCRERWNITDRRARQMIDAAQTVANLPTGTMVPVSERQARELVGLAPDEAADVMQRATEANHGRPTAAAIRQARTPQTPEPSPAQETDPEGGSGYPVDMGVGGDPHVSRPPVTGIDGKVYSRPAPRLVPTPEPDAWDELDRAEELASNLARNLSLLFAITNPERRAEYIANWRRGTSSRPVLGHDFVTPKHMRDLSAALITFANEWENADV